MAFVIDRNVLAGSGFHLERDISAWPEGIILPIDKPWRWTSADVIRKVKYAAIRHFGKKNLKVGHAGTLDPLATGVLLVCIGAATREAEALQRHDKEYRAGVSFGATTPSYDLEKEIDRTFPTDGVTREALEAVLPRFTGEQEQVAPLFSAKSVDGVRAYELARKLWRKGASTDEQAALLRRQHITIHSLHLLAFSADGSDRPVPADDADGASGRIHVADLGGRTLPRAELDICCSKGTYIRALARDLGEALGSGAFLDSLRRTRTGPFRAEDALQLDEVFSAACLGKA